MYLFETVLATLIWYASTCPICRPRSNSGVEGWARDPA
jgi:hypothetical protein